MRRIIVGHGEACRRSPGRKECVALKRSEKGRALGKSDIFPKIQKIFLLALIAGVMLCRGGNASADGGWKWVASVELPGPASRFDYESLDPTTGRLYLAHLGAGRLVVFDTRTRRVIADLPGFPHAHGVLAVPGLRRVYVTVSPRSNKKIGHLAVVDAESLRTIALVPTGIHPDGLDYDPVHKRVFVSNEWGKSLSVIDARSNRPAGTIPLGGEVGNTRYDPGSSRIYSTVQTRNMLVGIDPGTLRIKEKTPLPCRHPHGLLILPRRRLAFVACETDATLLEVDLSVHRVIGRFPTGKRPDVLSFDPARNLLFVASESGWVSVFHLTGKKLEKLSEDSLGFRAHSILVDPDTHLLYLPLENRNGHPRLDILSWQGD